MTKAVIYQSVPLSQGDQAMNELIASTFHRVCGGFPVNVLDIPIVFRAAREAINAGADKAGLEKAILGTVEKLRYDYK